MLWAQKFPKTQPKGANEYLAQGTNPVAMYRSSWSDSALYLGIKAGSPSANHAHMDVGSFVFEKNGVRWAVDLGLQDYHSIERLGMALWKKHKGSDRWKVFRNSVFSHNTLVVNDSLQNPEAYATIERVHEHTYAYKANVDLTHLYSPMLGQAKRTFGISHDQRLTITDSVRTGNIQTNTIRWGFATPTKVKLSKDGRTARLSKNEEKLVVGLLSPTDTAFKIYQTNPHPPPPILTLLIQEHLF